MEGVRFWCLLCLPFLALPPCSRSLFVVDCLSLLTILLALFRCFIGFSLLDENYAKIVDAVTSVEGDKVRSSCDVMLLLIIFSVTDQSNIHGTVRWQRSFIVYVLNSVELQALFLFSNAFEADLNEVWLYIDPPLYS